VPDAAFMITIGFLASVAMGATAKALGENANPAMKSTLSRTTSSWAWRLDSSGLGPPTSLTITTTFLPATVSPCSFW